MGDRVERHSDRITRDEVERIGILASATLPAPCSLAAHLVQGYYERKGTPIGGVYMDLTGGHESRLMIRSRGPESDG